MARRLRSRPARTGTGALLLVTALTALCGCTGSSTPTPAPATTTTASAHVNARSLGTLGTVLVDESGRRIYVLTSERGDHIACTGSCAAAWPPVVLPASVTEPMAGPGVRSALIGVIKLPGGQRQLTYARYPLHTYVGDTAPGDTNVGDTAPTDANGQGDPALLVRDVDLRNTAPPARRPEPPT